MSYNLAFIRPLSAAAAKAAAETTTHAGRHDRTRLIFSKLAEASILSKLCFIHAVCLSPALRRAMKYEL